MHKVKMGAQEAGKAMEYTLAEAATVAGVNRSTVLRAIKSGKVSARRLEDKSYRVDASEFARVFELRVHAQAVPGPIPGHAQGSPELAQAMPGHAQAAQAAQAMPDLAAAVELAELRVRVQLLERERETILAKQEDTIADLRKRLDAEQEERRVLQRLLAPPERPQERPQEPAGAVTATKPARGLLGRLLGR